MGFLGFRFGFMSVDGQLLDNRIPTVVPTKPLHVSLSSLFCYTLTTNVPISPRPYATTPTIIPAIVISSPLDHPPTACSNKALCRTDYKMGKNTYRCSQNHGYHPVQEEEGDQGYDAPNKG